MSEAVEAAAIAGWDAWWGKDTITRPQWHSLHDDVQAEWRESIAAAAPHLIAADRETLHAELDRALFGTEDGGQLPDECDLPVGELRRLLAVALLCTCRRVATTAGERRITSAACRTHGTAPTHRTGDQR